MSVYGPNQVEELIIGVTGETGEPAASGEVAVLKNDGSFAVPAAGDKFYVLQGTAGDSAKNLDYEFSDEVDPTEIESVTTHAYAAEVGQISTITGFASTANVVYSVKIRILQDGGTLSPENFRHVTGTFTTSATPESTQVIVEALTAQLQASLLLEGTGLFTVSEDNTTITVTGIVQDVVAGKITGRPVEFELEGQAKLIGGTGANIGLTIATTQESNPGIGTGKYAVNLEWFTKGYKYEVYRDVSYPANFDTPYYASAAAGYSVIHVKYKKQRKYTSVENQHKVLTILTLNPGKNLAGAAESNIILQQIATAWGTAVTSLPVA